MLIQCHSCTSKFRLNLDRFPRRKTFVRCRNCGAPIYIDATEDIDGSAAGAAALSGGGAAEQDAEDAGLQFHEEMAERIAGEMMGGLMDAIPDEEDPTSVVDCPTCDARYHVPPETLARSSLKLKCSRCGEVFAAYAPGAAAPEFYPRAVSAEGEDLEGPPMPVPDEGRLDSMFDDLRSDGSPEDGPDGARAGAGRLSPREVPPFGTGANRRTALFR